MANYFQTDDRDDYLSQFDNKRAPTNVTVIDPIGNTIFKSVPTWKVRAYYKKMYCKPGENGKKVWREKLTELGFLIRKG